VLALATTPLWGTNYVVRLAVVIAMYTALALSWNFIGGFRRAIRHFRPRRSSVSAAMSARLRSGPVVPIVLAWGIAMLFTGAFAAALGAIILRLRGHYFAIGSIAIVEVVRLVISSWAASPAAATASICRS